jgi:uncharacterized protein (DUF2147 family)
MKRFACLMVLAALTTPAHAGSYSFVIGGHHIHLEASRHCRSLSCVSWSETNKKRDRNDTDDVKADPAPAQAPVATAAPAPLATMPAPVVARAVVAPVAAPAPVAVARAPVVPQPQIAVAPVQTQVPPAQVQPPAAPVAAPAIKPVETRAVNATPTATLPAPLPPAQTPQAAPVVTADTKTDPKIDAKADSKVDVKDEAKPRVGFDLKPDAKLEPKIESKIESKVETKPVEPKIETRTEAKADPKPDTTASVAKTPAEKPQADKPAVVTKPAPSKSSLQSEGDGVEAPTGDWQTEGRKGLVRIEPCGTALCGYMINASGNAKGETVLINMKPRHSGKANSEWSGSIYSRASGNTYNAIMTIKKPNTLRVEACVVGHYFCSGNDWTRIAPKPDDIVSPRDTREASAEPVR